MTNSIGYNQYFPNKIQAKVYNALAQSGGALSNNGTGSTQRGSATGTFGSTGSNGTPAQDVTKEQALKKIKELDALWHSSPEFASVEKLFDQITNVYDTAGFKKTSLVELSETACENAQKRLENTQAYKDWQKAVDDYKKQFGESPYQV